MEDYKIEINSKMVILSKLLYFYKNNSKIKENPEDLYKITEKYLNELDINPRFFDKPAVIERVKNIIFNNLVLSDNMKLNSRGISAEDYTKGKVTKKILSVLQDGSLMYYFKSENEKKAVVFDEFENNIVCRFLEYNNDDKLKYEKRVIIDDYGFDNKYYEITGYSIPDDINEHFRENFRKIITHVNGLEITAFSDWGNHSITPVLDNRFLNSSKSEKINRDELYEENRLKSVLIKDDSEMFFAFPDKIEEIDEYSIIKIQEAFEYYVPKYSGAKGWFINRFGKKFLIDNDIISQDDEFCEKTIEHKIKDSNIDELMINFQDIDMNEDENISLIENLYEENFYEKSVILFKKLNKNFKKEFLELHNDYESKFISACIKLLDQDDDKIKLLENENFDFSINDKVEIIASLKDEETKDEMYNEILDEIIEFDEKKLESFENEEIILPVVTCLSEIVLNSFKDKERIKEYILKFDSFPIINYEHLKDMDKEDIDELLDEIGENLDTEGYIAFLRTNFVNDDEILKILEDNWDEGLEFAKGDEIELANDISYTFKVFALLKVKNDEKRLKFLEENIDEFSPEEISEVLTTLEDSEQMLKLAKEYNLPKDYYYYLLTLCEDELKFNNLKNDENIDINNFQRVVTSITDTENAFEYVLNLNKLDVIEKMKVINEFEFAFDDNSENLYEKKFKFLDDNRKQIMEKIKTPDDYEVFSIYASEFWDDYEKMERIEQEFSTILDDAERDV